MDGGFVLPCTHALCSVRAVPCQDDAADVLNEKKRALTRASMACVREKDRMLWARRESCRAEQSLRSSEALACGVLIRLGHGHRAPQDAHGVSTGLSNLLRTC